MVIQIEEKRMGGRSGKQVNARFPIELLERMDNVEGEFSSRSELVRHAVRKFLDEREVQT